MALDKHLVARRGVFLGCSDFRFEHMCTLSGWTVLSYKKSVSETVWILTNYLLSSLIVLAALW